MQQAAPLLVAVLRCRCPRCGKGSAFSGFLETPAACSVCGLELKAIDNGDGPAVFLIFLLGGLVVPTAIWFSGHTDLPLWAQSGLWGVVILGLTIGMLRPAKALVLALNYRARASV